MNRRNAALAVVLVAAGAVGGVAADRVFGSSSSSPVRDAWSTQEGRAVVEVSPEADVDYFAIEDETSVLIAVRPVPGQHYLTIPLQRQQQVATEAVSDARPDLVIPGIAVRGERTASEPITPGSYRVVAIEDGERVDSTTLVVDPAAVDGCGVGDV